MVVRSDDSWVLVVEGYPETRLGDDLFRAIQASVEHGEREAHVCLLGRDSVGGIQVGQRPRRISLGAPVLGACHERFHVVGFEAECFVYVG